MAPPSEVNIASPIATPVQGSNHPDHIQEMRAAAKPPKIRAPVLFIPGRAALRLVCGFGRDFGMGGLAGTAVGLDGFRGSGESGIGGDLPVDESATHGGQSPSPLCLWAFSLALAGLQ